MSSEAHAGRPPLAAPALARARSALARWEGLIVGLILGMLVLGTWLSPDAFLTGDNFSFASAAIVEIAIMALALALVVIAAEIDLSVASVLGLSSALMGSLWNAGLPVEMILPVVLAAGATCGLVNGLLVTYGGLPSLAVTIGTLALYRGLAFVVLGDEAVADFPELWTDLAFGNVPGTPVPYPVALFALLAIGFAVLLHKTAFGRSIYAIGANQDTAFFSGIHVKRIKTILFVLSGTVAALAGAILTLRLSSARADNGTGFELVVVAAVVLGGISIFGGRGTILGVVLALVLLGGIQNALTLGDLSQEWVQIVTGALLVGSVLGPGLAGRMRARRRGSRDPGRWPARRKAIDSEKEEGKQP